MTTRSGLQALALFLAALLFLSPTIARAEDEAQDIENSKFQAQGEINSNAVYIRSGASENDYPTIKLDRGAQVTVVGVRGDWLKLQPPDGSYCYVAKAYVEKRGDGTVGRVTNPLNVRVGSSLNAMKTKVATHLDAGADVSILGEQDEYFKIAPPKDVYYYVNKQFVDLVKTLPPSQAKPNEPVPVVQTPTAPLTTMGDQSQQTTTPEQAQTPTAQNDNTTGVTPDPAQNTQAAITPPSTQPANPDQTASNQTTAAQTATAATPPATQPSEADAENQFDQLEKTFIESDQKPIDQQPIADLQSGYEKLIAGNVLPESLRRMCVYRVSTLKQRSEDQQRYVAVKKSQDEMRQRQVALQAEREELEQRIKASGVKYYTAVGTLRVSSLQQGGGTLYRLTDPASGRTVIYLRSEDPKIGSLLGQFIGVQGTVQDEQALDLKSIAPTSFEAVDQSKVNITVASQIVPPSLMPAGTASTGSEIGQ